MRDCALRCVVVRRTALRGALRIDALPGLRRRYCVRLPTIAILPDLSTSRRLAVRVLLCMERRFRTEPRLEEKYKTFMAEYEELKHMTPVDAAIGGQPRLCYLPHHGVMKGDYDTGKLRVVFNASHRLPSGASLNHHVMAGPNLLPLLCDVLMRWRKHRYTMVTDIEKMYRQILVHPKDRDLQRIVWQAKNDMQDFQLVTVTYGIACAPYLALRTLQQLAKDDEQRFPVGAAVLRQDVYVDDFLTRADTLDKAQTIRDQLISLCKAGGFPLKKWSTNREALLSTIPEDYWLATNCA